MQDKKCLYVSEQKNLKILSLRDFEKSKDINWDRELDKKQSLWRSSVSGLLKVSDLKSSVWSLWEKSCLENEVFCPSHLWWQHLRTYQHAQVSYLLEVLHTAPTLVFFHDGAIYFSYCVFF
jgi:hypothetical protein